MRDIYARRLWQRFVSKNKLRILTRQESTLSGRDKKLIWHPFSQEKTAAEPIAIRRAQGSYVYDEADRPYLDLVSSWWVNIHGHAHPEIANTIYKQALTLDHVIFAGFTHEPAVTLCESLATIFPPKLSRYFFSDNGSTTVEIALKMAYQYWWNLGENERTLFVSFSGGYHGDTFGAMNVGKGSRYHSTYEKFFFDSLLVPFPATWDEDVDVVKKEVEAISLFQSHLEKNSKKIAAVILEPLVQGASGMRMCRNTFVDQVVEIARENGILVIFDEVMTGFGRTGSLFAFNQLTQVPDFLCISKGITGGFLPLALTVTTDKIYNTFLADSFSKAFAHGHSYTANPIACSAAIKSLEILQRPQTRNAITKISEAHAQGLAQLKKKCGNIVQNTRQLGTIVAFEISGTYNFDLNLKLKKIFAMEGLLLRPIGNTLYLLPPYSTTPEEIESAYQIISSVILKL